MLKSVNSFLKEEIAIGNLTVYRIALYIFLLVSFLLLVFKPFGLSLLDTLPILVLTLGYGIVSVLGYGLIIFIVKPSKKEKWTRLQDILTYTASFFLIWLFVYVYTLLCINVIFPRWPPFYNLSIPNYLFIKTFIYTIGTGYFIYFILHLYDLLYYYHKKDEYNMSLKQCKEHNSKKLNSIILLRGKNEDESISLHKGLFVCIRSRGHYIKVFYLSKNNSGYTLKNKIFRASLKEVEFQTSHIKSIYRCHNSYIINLDHLKSIYGNIHKAYLYILHYPESIPISKNKIAYLISLYEKKHTI